MAINSNRKFLNRIQSFLEEHDATEALTILNQKKPEILESSNQADHLLFEAFTKNPEEVVAMLENSNGRNLKPY